MATKTNPSSHSTYSYVDFEPYCERKDVEGVETLIVHLPSFKKEQLRVQVSNQGVLRLTGERPLTGDGTRKSRFRIETNIPQCCDIHNIRAKFVNNQLQVIMPKQLPNAHTQQVQQQQQQQLKSQQDNVNVNPKVDALVANDQGLNKGSNNSNVGNGRMMGVLSSYYGNAKDGMYGLVGRSLAMLHDGNNVGVGLGLGIAMLVMVGIGTFVAYKCGSNATTCSCIEVQA